MARFGRTLALIGFVTTVFLMLAVNRLEGTALRVGIVGISVVAFVTAIVGFLVAAATTFDDSI
jgi:ABC-type enterobactin transport system permease subunit